MQLSSSAEGPVGVRKLKNGKWIADVVVGAKWDGSPDRRTKTTTTKALAEKAERQFLLTKEVHEGKVADIKFRDLLKEYYWPSKTQLRANTKRGYERDINLKLILFFGDMYIGDIGSLTSRR